MASSEVYATYAQLKAEINLKDTALAKQTTIERLLSTASRVIDNYCNRPDGFVALSTGVARIFPGSGTTWQPIDDCVSVSAIAVKKSIASSAYTAWALSDIILCAGDLQWPEFNSAPYHALLIDPTGDETLFTSGLTGGSGGFSPSKRQTLTAVPTVQVTAKWGFAIICPSEILTATIMIATKEWKRLESGMSDTLASADLSQLMYTMKVDPDVALILEMGGYIMPMTGRR